MTLRMTIEIVPFGAEPDKRTIHTINISNMRLISQTLDGVTCGYEIKLDGVALPHEITHVRQDGALALCLKALEHLIGT